MSAKDGRTEKPTAQRRRKAREEGQIARSQEVAVAGSLVGLAATLAIAGGPIVTRTIADMRTIFSTAASPHAFEHIGTSALQLLVVLALPFLVVAVVTGVSAGVAQVGFSVHLKRAKPKISHLSLKRGLERLKPSVAAWELTRSILKLAALGIVIGPTLSAWRNHLANDRTLAGALDRLTGVYGGVLVRAAILALVIALADYAFQRRRTEKKLMMSRQDIKREFRDSEGDPQLRAARRKRQGELSRNRMLRDVATADVVVANPTHLVVALSYAAEDGAPRVVAKGADHVAETIKSIARAHGIPVTTNVPLARALFRQCRLGQFVPAPLFEAVAVVLAEAYRRTNRAPGSRRAIVRTA